MHIIVSKTIHSLFETHHINFTDNGRPRIKVGDTIYLDNNALIEPYTAFNAGSCLVTMGAFTYSQSAFAKVVAVIIGRYCSIAKGLTIQGTNHPIHRFTTSPVTYDNQIVIVKQSLAAHSESGYHTVTNPKDDVNYLPITIGNDVWIGENVTVVRGVTIGDGAIVGSNALVSKDVPPYAIVGGIPAKLIKYRFNAVAIDALCQLKWWNYAYWDFAEHEMDSDITLFIELVNSKKNNKTLLPYEPQPLAAKDVFVQFVTDIANLPERKIDHRDVDYCLNLALKLEKNDLSMALLLMKAASKLRPKGPMIIKKLAQYQQELATSD
jgi:acetyltransferase-like isoleucine patch superfamily enzyme